MQHLNMFVDGPLLSKYIDACSVGDVDMIAQMIKHEDKKFKNNYTLFKCAAKACENGHANVFNAILEYDNIFMDTHHDVLNIINIVYYACKGNNLDIINKIIEMSKKTLKSSDEIRMFWRDALIGICTGGELEIYKMYMMYDEYNLYCDYLECLYAACMSGSINLVKYLVNQGVEVADRVLNSACRNGDPEIVEFLISNGSKFSYNSLYNACISGNKKLINKLCDILLTNYEKDEYDEQKVTNWITTLVCGMCRKGDLEIVNIMVDNEFTQLDDGFRHACIGGHLEIVKLMIDMGSKDWNDGANHACQNEHMKLLKFLIEKGATEYDLYLHSVCCYGDMELMQFIIDRCEKENYILDWKGGLRGALKGGYSDIVRLMLKYASDIKHDKEFLNESLCDNNSCDVDISYLLIQYGATDFECLKNTRNFRLYCMYCKCAEIKHDNNNELCVSLIRGYSPFVLLVGSVAMRKSAENSTCFIKKLPVELFRLLFTFYQ